MATPHDFPTLLRLLDDRSAAYRAALAAAPGTDVPVPTCPEWSLHDLTQHLGHGQRFWAAIVAAGPSDAPPPRPTEPAPTDRDELAAWFAASTEQLLDALRTAGPDSPCWTWWALAQSPQDTTGAARRRLNETAVHTYDAQLAAGVPAALPQDVALDGAEEFLFTCCSTTVAWPHDPAVLHFRAADGPTWQLTLSAAGAHADRTLTTDSPDAVLRGTAAELVGCFYGRVRIDDLQIEGNGAILHQLYDWEPEG